MRLKFSENPLTNALDVINRLEPCEYQQTQEIVDQWTPDIQQSHQCGLKAQSVEQIEELRHAVVGGEIGDDGQEALRALSYNAVFTFAVKAIQELSDIVMKQQEQIDVQKQQIDRLINMILIASLFDTLRNNVHNLVNIANKFFF